MSGVRAKFQLVLARLVRRVPEPARWSDAWFLAAFGGALRLAAVAWAASKFPPAADGQFYDTVARRIAQGLGYTWLWPDGAVTFAAHYPVGYPTLIAGLYALFGPNPVWAMLLNALLGSLAVLASYWVAVQAAGRLGGVAAGLLVAIHPSLVLYTPALMTEGVAAALYVIAACLALRASRHGAVTAVLWLGLALGVATLVRPQTLLLAPVFGAAATLRRPRAQRARQGRARPGWWRAALTTMLVVVVCLPWTLRNCARMERCVFVSANGGWNLLIGTEPRARGAWMALSDLGVPPECREVFQEAAKDRCFGNAALERIWADPIVWLSLVPSKLSATFDTPAAPAHYLAMSNGVAFDHDAEQMLLGIETAWQRLLLALGLLGVARLPGPRARVRRGFAVAGALSLCTPLGWPAVLALLAAAASLGRELFDRRALVLSTAVLAATVLMHAVFFGAGRYALVYGYVAGVLAALAFRRPASAVSAAT